MDGFGEFTYPNTKTYLGYFKKDKKNGFGIVFWENNEKCFIGFWKNNKQNGLGKFISQGKGKGKAKAVNELVNGVYTKKCPITALRNHGKVTLYTDEEAGEMIKEYNKKF